jgi:hypothetical protein
MANYLITPTLLNSFSYYMSEYGKRGDFMKTLSRERFESTEAMLKGIRFEESVRSLCEGLSDNEDRIIAEIAAIVSAGVWQATVQKPLKIDDTEYLLYGKCDVIKQNFIYDIKFTSNYEVGKFQDSIQHQIYMYCTGLTDFAYLVSNGKEFWIEDYKASKDIENVIKSRILEFRDYLSGDKEAENLFLTKWISK